MRQNGGRMDRKWWVLVSIGVGTFMSAANGSVVNAILPVLARDLGTSVAGIEWVSVVYLLVISALLLGVGRLGDLYGHKRLYLAGYLLFVAGALACALSGSAGMLAATRALQGVGAAMLFANSPAILTREFPASQRGRALGAQATFTYLGLTAGPSLGGWMVNAYGWPSVFHVNLPIGALGIALALRSIEDDRPARGGERFDFGGAALFTAGLTALLLALNLGHAWGWGSPRIIVLFAGAVSLLAAFVAVEGRSAAPMLDLTLFRSRIFGASSAGALLNYVCVSAIIFVMPFLLIQGRGLNAAQAGLVLTAQPLVMAVVAPVAGALSDRMGSRPLAAAGMLILALAIASLALLAPTSAPSALAGALALAGLGLGLFTSPNNSALMGSAPPHRQGIAAAVLATSRNVGMVLGVGLAGAVFTTILAHRGAAAVFEAASVSLWVTAGVAFTGMLVALFGD